MSATVAAATVSDPPPSHPTGETTSCTLNVVDFDFANKIEKSIAFDEAHEAMAAGRFVWVDIHATDVAEARRLLQAMKIIAEETINDALKNEPATQHARYDNYVHIVLSG